MSTLFEFNKGFEALDQFNKTSAYLSEAYKLFDTCSQLKLSMSAESVAIVQISIESIYDRLGIKKEVRLPALENFSNKSTQVMATNLALEGMKEFLSTLWLKLKAFAKWIWEIIKDFFGRYIREDRIQRKRVARNRAEINAFKQTDLPKAKPKGTLIEHTRLFNAFSIKEICNGTTALKVVHDQTHLVKESEYIFNGIFERMNLLNSLVNKTNLYEEYRAITGYDVLNSTDTPKEDTEILEYCLFNGEKLQLTKKTLRSLQYISKAHFTKRPVYQYPRNIDILTLDECEMLNYRSSDLIRIQGNLIQTIKKVESPIRAFEKTCERLAAQLTGPNEKYNENDLKVLRLIADEMKEHVNVLNVLVLNVGRTVKDTIDNTNGYVQVSLRELKRE